MRISCFLVAIFAVMPLKAEWIELPWPALGATLPIWKPDSFNAAKKYPAIVYYHGDAAPPDARFVHGITGGEDFVIVGMAYRGGESDQAIADGLGFLNAVRKTLSGSLSVDPERLYVGGSGNGAVHAAMLLDRDRSLAGGFILSGGLLEKRTTVSKFSPAVPIHIACERFDVSYAPSLRAFVYFRKLGAKVTLETLTDGADRQPEGLRQWLRLQGSKGAAAVEASSWIDKRLEEIEAIPESVERWYAYEEFLTMPFASLFESDVVKERILQLLKDPVVSTEKKWRDESRSILARESSDRLLITMQNALGAHRQLADKAAGTRAGRDALEDVKRVSKVIETAKIVTLPDEPKPEPITPEAAPSAPSANPDRSPFFPPGTKVKPAR
jgi:predicted esterase